MISKWTCSKFAQSIICKRVAIPKFQAWKKKERKGEEKKETMSYRKWTVQWWAVVKANFTENPMWASQWTPFTSFLAVYSTDPTLPGRNLTRFTPAHIIRQRGPTHSGPTVSETRCSFCSQVRLIFAPGWVEITVHFF